MDNKTTREAVDAWERYLHDQVGPQRWPDHVQYGDCDPAAWFDVAPAADLAALLAAPVEAVDALVASVDARHAAAADEVCGMGGPPDSSVDDGDDDRAQSHAYEYYQCIDMIKSALHEQRLVLVTRLTAINARAALTAAQNS